MHNTYDAPSTVFTRVKATTVLRSVIDNQTAVCRRRSTKWISSILLKPVDHESRGTDLLSWGVQWLLVPPVHGVRCWTVQRGSLTNMNANDFALISCVQHKDYENSCNEHESVVGRKRTRSNKCYQHCLASGLKTLHRLPLMECTFPPLLFLHTVPSPVWEEHDENFLLGRC